MRYLILFFLFFSCDNYFKNNNNLNIARVEAEYLNQQEVDEIFDSSSSSNDILIILNNYINNWAANRLLIERALINLTEENQNVIRELVDNYQNEILINSYVDALVSENMNLEISISELDSLYQKYKETFKLSEELFKFSFIYIPKVNPDIKLFKSKLKRFNPLFLK